MIRFLVRIALCVLVLAARPLPAQTFADDFRSYPAGSDGSPHWITDGIGWSMAGSAFLFDGAGAGAAVYGRAPMGRRVVAEADVTPSRAGGTEWKTAGVAIRLDDRNFWHLALVESPDARGRTRSFELQEMLTGRWLANSEPETRLPGTGAEGMQTAWQYGRTYHLRLECTHEGVEGSIRDSGGALIAHSGYRFEGRAVMGGRPALVSGSLNVAFSGFRAETADPLADPALPDPQPYTMPPMTAIRGERTGFFHPQRIGDRWWWIDPKGSGFYAVGTDHVNYFAHFCEKLGYAPYSRNVIAKFGAEEKWAADAAERLRRWGFNLLGAGCGESMRYRGLAHTEFVAFGSGFSPIADIVPRTTWTGFPDVFDPRWARWCDNLARRVCGPARRDPWLLGYFLDNELEWFGKTGSETGLVDGILLKPASHPARRALVAFLRDRYTDIGRLNAVWGIAASDWDTISAGGKPSGALSAGALEDRRAFVRLIADRYFSVACAAIRKADPNHAIIGCRFAGDAPRVWEAAGRHLDVVSVNFYGQVDLERRLSPDMPGRLADYARQCGRPMMITEWSFPALDAGLPSRNGAGQRVATQREKAEAYSIYQRHLFEMPFMIGSDYFMWADEPALGISATFPEDSNYGLVDVNDRAWSELTATASIVNRMAAAIHSARCADLTVRVSEGLAGAAVIVRNRGKVRARARLRLAVQGAQRELPVTLDAGAARTIPVRVAYPSYVTAELVAAAGTPEANLRNNRDSRLVGLERAPRPSVIVVNPTAMALRDVPAAAALAAPGAWRVVGPAGEAPAQVDALAAGAELAFRVPLLPAGSAVVFRLLPGGRAVVTPVAFTGDTLSAAGALTLERGVGKGPIISRVLLGGRTLGSYTMLVHQDNGQPLWTPADEARSIRVCSGPARTTIEAVFAGGASGAMTAVDTSGAYASQITRPLSFEVALRISAWPGAPAFESRAVAIRNTSSSPSRVVGYYHYPVSFIGGNMLDDEPGGTASAPRWYDPKAELSYGASVNPGLFKASFWKDPGVGGGEHADIWRTIGRTLAPGELLRLPADEPAVRVFGVAGDSAAGTNPDVRRLDAIGRVTVRLLR